MKTPLILSLVTLTGIPGLAGPLPPVAPMPVTAGRGVRLAIPSGSLPLGSGARRHHGSGTGDVNMDFSDIASDLDFAFMGAFEARYGRWGILTDVNYAETSDSFAVRGVLFSSGEFKMQQLLGNVTLNYRLVESEDTVIDLYGGARLNWIDLDVTARGEVGVAATRAMIFGRMPLLLEPGFRPVSAVRGSSVRAATSEPVVRTSRGRRWGWWATGSVIPAASALVIADWAPTTKTAAHL